MSNTVVANQYLLGTQSAPVTTGTGNWCAVVGGPISLAVTTTMLGAVSAGTILIEETDDPQDGSIGTMAQLASITAAAGPGKLVNHIAPGSFGYVRARITSAIVGGSAYVEIAGS
jgi:hypothetical protein